MTAPLHFPWCDPPSCDVDAEGYSAHRSRVVWLNTYSIGPVELQLYATSKYPDGRLGLGPTVLVGDFMSLPLSSLVLAMHELESLQQPRVVSTT